MIGTKAGENGLRSYDPKAFRHAAQFCEENVWWLAQALIDDGIDAELLHALVFSNPWEHIVLLNQRQAESNRALVWDYHVVLEGQIDDRAWIFDLDSRLPLPTPAEQYFAETFPKQLALPEPLRAWVRPIPAQRYLAHFYSDRSHMIGQVAISDFPAWPIIAPSNASERVSLHAYRDMRQCIVDGCIAQPLGALVERLLNSVQSLDR